VQAVKVRVLSWAPLTHPQAFAHVYEAPVIRGFLLIGLPPLFGYVRLQATFLLAWK
jgi:hypothetical protein